MFGNSSVEANEEDPPRYDLEIDMDSSSTQARVVRLVGADKRVLELGCATGYMSRVLRQRGCSIVAVEIDPKAAKRAEEFCERVIVGDLDSLDLDGELGTDVFDVVLAADVIEHLKHPLDVLRAVKRHLKPEGHLVASLPNVAHGSLRLALLEGRFPYGPLGLLDDSHLRFFTRESMLRLFEEADFVVGHLERKNAPLEATEIKFDPLVIPDGLLAWLADDPDAMTYQFILTAYPLPRRELRYVQQLVSSALAAQDAAVHELERERQSKKGTQDEISQCHELIRRQADELRARTEEIVIRDARIGQLEQLQAERENALCAELVAKHSQEIGWRDARVSQLEQLIAGHSHEIALRDAKILELGGKLERLRQSPPGRIYRAMRKVVRRRG